MHFELHVTIRLTSDVDPLLQGAGRVVAEEMQAFHQAVQRLVEGCGYTLGDGRGEIQTSRRLINEGTPPSPVTDENGPKAGFMSVDD